MRRVWVNLAVGVLLAWAAEVARGRLTMAQRVAIAEHLSRVESAARELRRALAEHLGRGGA